MRLPCGPPFDIYYEHYFFKTLSLYCKSKPSPSSAVCAAWGCRQDDAQVARRRDHRYAVAITWNGDVLIRLQLGIRVDDDSFTLGEVDDQPPFSRHAV